MLNLRILKLMVPQQQLTGITYTVDENKKRKGYHFSFTETYIFDADDPNLELKVLDSAIRDLDRIKDTLTALRGKRISQKNFQEQSDELELQ